MNTDILKLPAETSIESINLKVRDIESTLNFYTNLLGLKVIEKDCNEYYLSATGKQPYLIKLSEDKNAPVRMRGTPGLYHTAILFPNRKELARVFLRLFDRKIKFQGFADHLVSEAIYLADPEGNGIELYVDKPKEVWKKKSGEIQMDSLPLDLSLITKELDDRNEWNGIHPETKIGHIHLNVSDLKKAEIFFNEVLGFKISNSTYPGAFFFAAGDYHHHIGTNIWQTRRGATADVNSLGMTGFKIKIPDREVLKIISQRADKLNLNKKAEDNSQIVVNDFDGNEITLKD